MNDLNGVTSGALLHASGSRCVPEKAPSIIAHYTLALIWWRSAVERPIVMSGKMATPISYAVKAVSETKNIYNGILPLMDENLRHFKVHGCADRVV